jgi:O-antigen/teichoic acid export membrane protein
MTRFGAWSVRRALSDDLVRTSAWLFIGFAVSSVFNYGFQIAMGRLLSPTQFGLLNVLLGVCVVLSVPVSTLLMVLSKKAAECQAARDLPGVRGLLTRANRTVMVGGLAGLALFTLASSAIAGYLRVPSLAPVIILGACIFSSFLSPINMALLQGLQNYTWVGISQGLGGPLKFAFCMVLVLAGFGLNGALAGLLVSQIVLWLLSSVPVRRSLAGVSAPLSSAGPGAAALKRVLPILLANLAFTLITQMDLVLVNRYFPAQESAIYASAAVLGRSVMYIPATLVLAMFPMVSEKQALNRDTNPLLLKSLLMTFCLSGTGALLFYAMPEWILLTFFGAQYAGAAPLLKYFGVAMLPLALLLVLYNYMIACGRSGFSYCMLVMAGIDILLIHSYHGSLLGVVFITAVSSLLLLAGGLCWMRTSQASVEAQACRYA